MRVALDTRIRADRIAEYEAAHRDVSEELTRQAARRIRRARPSDAPAPPDPSQETPCA